MFASDIEENALEKVPLNVLFDTTNTSSWQPHIGAFYMRDLKNVSSKHDQFCNGKKQATKFAHHYDQNLTFNT